MHLVRQILALRCLPYKHLDNQRAEGHHATRNPQRRTAPHGIDRVLSNDWKHHATYTRTTSCHGQAHHPPLRAVEIIGRRRDCWTKHETVPDALEYAVEYECQPVVCAEACDNQADDLERAADCKKSFVVALVERTAAECAEEVDE